MERFTATEEMATAWWRRQSRQGVKVGASHHLP